MNDSTSFINRLMGRPTMYDYVLESLEEGKPNTLFQRLGKRKQSKMSISMLRKFFLKNGCKPIYVERKLNQIMKERILNGL